MSATPINVQPPAPQVCPNCATQLAPGLLMCPSCRGLVHAVRLKDLARQAREAEGENRLRESLELWRESLELLPPGSRQHSTISEKCAELSRQLDTAGDGAESGSAGRAKSSGGWKKAAGGLAGLALLIWKFKFVASFLVTKAKFLLLGLSKGGTFVSMLLSFGVYWTAWGWKFALGIVASIYVHEMGHIAALRKFGIKASMPMFVPGLGAFIRLKQYPTSPREDARVGLAGPIWGLAAVIFSYLVFKLTGSAAWGAIAKFSAWINLFNLLPVWQLDGGRGFRALAKNQRWLAAAAVGVAWFVTADGILILIGIVAAMRAAGDAPETPDNIALAQFVSLIFLLAAFAAINIPGAEATVAASK